MNTLESIFRLESTIEIILNHYQEKKVDHEKKANTVAGIIIKSANGDRLVNTFLLLNLIKENKDIPQYEQENQENFETAYKFIQNSRYTASELIRLIDAFHGQLPSCMYKNLHTHNDVNCYKALYNSFQELYNIHQVPIKERPMLTKLSTIVMNQATPKKQKTSDYKDLNFI